MATISNNDRITGPLQPAAGSTSLSTDFPVFAVDDLVVLRRATGSDWTRLVLGVDYAVGNLEQDAGASVTLTQPSTAGDEYLLIGAMRPEPETAFVPGQKFPADGMNRELGRIWAAIQELRRASGQDAQPGAQPLLLPAGERETLPPAAHRAGQVLEFDAAGRPITRVSIDALGDIHTMRWRGSWQGGTSYEPLDMVHHQGITYIVTAAHVSDTSTEPGVGASWQAVLDVVVQATNAPGSITSVELADGSVIAAKIAAGAVDATKLATGAVGTSALSDGSITDTKLAAGAVQPAHLAATIWHDGNVGPRILSLPEDSAPAETDSVVLSTGKRAQLAQLPVGKPDFESGWLTYAAPAGIIVAHGLGQPPSRVHLCMKCIVANQGYNPGEIVYPSGAYGDISSTAWADLSNIYIPYSSSFVYIYNKNAVRVLLNAQYWKIKIIAYK